MRKLVSIQRIEEIKPIPGADAIEKARVMGWWCVVKRDEFKTGDLCLYHEVDSFLPVVSQYDFLSRGSRPKKMIVDGSEKEGWRLKTISLRGQVSQGLALPLALFPQVTSTEVGFDVTDLLGVRLYEAPVPACLSGEVIGAFPGFIPKTDEDRIQGRLDMLDEYRGRRFYVTVKLDGSSSTIYKYRGEFGVCGRTLNFKESEKNTFWRLVNKYNLRDKIPEGYAIQSECAGEGIQDNRHKLKGQDFFVFYVLDIEKFKYLGLEEMEDFVQSIGLGTVPVFDRDLVLGHTLEDLLQMADGECPLNPGVLREGLVFRLRGEDRKISFKAISNQYLLRYGL